MVRPFEEHTVARRTPDPLRAAYLDAESERTIRFIRRVHESIAIDDDNATILIRLAYDSLLERIRGRMHEAGLHASGHGAHEAEVAYLRELGVSEADVRFSDDLRKLRNGITYAGERAGAADANHIIGTVERIRTMIAPEQSPDTHEDSS
jgi:hypothetical protein